jgi:hypothetical protein
VHTRGQAENIDTTFTKLELAMNTLCKVKSAESTQANTHFVQITKFNKNLVFHSDP